MTSAESSSASVGSVESTVIMNNTNESCSCTTSVALPVSISSDRSEKVDCSLEKPSENDERTRQAKALLAQWREKAEAERQAAQRDRRPALVHVSHSNESLSAVSRGVGPHTTQPNTTTTTTTTTTSLHPIGIPALINVASITPTTTTTEAQQQRPSSPWGRAFRSLSGSLIPRPGQSPSSSSRTNTPERKLSEANSSGSRDDISAVGSDESRITESLSISPRPTRRGAPPRMRRK